MSVSEMHLNVRKLFADTLRNMAHVHQSRTPHELNETSVAITLAVFAAIDVGNLLGRDLAFMVWGRIGSIVQPLVLGAWCVRGRPSPALGSFIGGLAFLVLWVMKFCEVGLRS